MATDPQKAFNQELRDRLRDRAQLLLATDQATIAELMAARDQILQILAAQPADWREWQLRQLLDQINTVLEGAGVRTSTIVDKGIVDAWAKGEAFVDKPLAAGGFNVELQLPALDVGVLQQLRTFATLRLKDVATEAARKIGSQLSLVTIGAETPFNAIKAVQKQLGNESPRRATTIVRTEVGRAFAVANFQRMQQAAALVPGLQKKWRRSGKIHSRWNHDAADGQIQNVDDAFVLPSHEGPVKLMYPHDPQAPVGEVINCGCLALPWRSTWKVRNPAGKPFSADELRLDKRKADLDAAAKRAGLRAEAHPSAIPNWIAARIPQDKLVKYSLDPDHPVGGNKARKFDRVLGITAEDADDLRDQILAGLKVNPAVDKGTNGFGRQYEVDVDVTGPKGTAIVRTGWIIEDGTDFPRMTSTYIRKGK